MAVDIVVVEDEEKEKRRHLSHDNNNTTTTVTASTTATMTATTGSNSNSNSSNEEGEENKWGQTRPFRLNRRQRQRMLVTIVQYIQQKENKVVLKNIRECQVLKGIRIYQKSLQEDNATNIILQCPNEGCLSSNNS